MKLNIKFFIWKIQIKTKKLNSEEKVKFLMNELVKSIQDCGYSLQNPTISKNFASLEFYIHNYGLENSSMYVGNNGWKIECKPNFKLLEADKNE